MRLDIELAPTAQAAPEARVLIRQRFADDVPGATLHELLTVVTELVTNAVRHGQGDAVHVRLSMATDGKISGEVENYGLGRVEPRPLETSRSTGLGLHIVSAIADRWSVLVDRSTRVRFELFPL